MKTIYVVGSTNQDIVCIMDKFPSSGETLHGNDLKYFQGGKGANQAIAASNMDGNVNFISMIGNDAFGKELKKYFDKIGLNNKLYISKTRPTGTAIINVNKEGNNNIVIISGANAELTINLLDINPKKGDILLIQNELSVDMVELLLSYGKKNDMITIFNCAPAISIENFIDKIDYLIVNEHELSIALNLSNFNKDNIEDIKSTMSVFNKKNNLNIITTIGEKGVIANIDGIEYDIKGHKVNVVDTTGAGDCFCGTFVACLSKGWDINKCLLYANYASSISIQKLGASTSCPNFNDIKNNIENNIKKLN